MRRALVLFGFLILAGVDILAQAGIYWTTYFGGQVWRANADGSSAQAIVSGQTVPIGVAADARHVYWTSDDLNTVYMANLDGSSPQTIVTGQNRPMAIAVDGTQIYWVNYGQAEGEGSIYVANLDGTSPHAIMSSLVWPVGIAVHGTSLYWIIYGTSDTTGAVWVANLDGTGAHAIVTGQNYPSGIAVGSQVYWTSYGTNSVLAANLDGTNPHAIVTGQNGPAGIALSSTNLYWANYSSGTLGEANLDGSGVHTIVSGQDTPWGVTYTAGPVTISGNAGVAGATLSYTDGIPRTATADGSGSYSLKVSPGWSGTVTPSLTGYTFTPPSRSYSNVVANQTSQDYTANPITFTISGNAGIAWATLAYTDGTPKTATADGSGNYSLTVSYNWSGTVTPSYTGYSFTPASRSYTNVLSNQTSQDYTATPITPTISGNAGIAWATLAYTDGTPKTATADGSGNYFFTVSYNWSGVVTPSYTGYTFTPPSRSYTNVVANQNDQDYTATLLTLELTVTKSGPGWGVVSSTPPGIDCGTDCSELYDYGTEVTLIPSPDPGCELTGWSGACTGTGECTVTMDEARSVGAAFRFVAPTDVMLRVGTTGAAGGVITATTPEISCATTCAQWVPIGDTVILTATPDAGNELVTWLGDCAGAVDDTCTLVMGGNKLAVAAFEVTGDRYDVRHHFVPGDADGQDPYYGALLAEGGYLYGLTFDGGIRDFGTLFRQRPDGSEHTVLHDFSGQGDDGAYPYGSLIAVGGRLFGMASEGGSLGLGVIFAVDPDGTDFELVHSFAGGAGDGSYPYGSLLESSGVLYGATSSGGNAELGAVFKVNPDGSGFGLLHSFAGQPGDGALPNASLVIIEGVLVGTTFQGGTANLGSVFWVALDGSDHGLAHEFAGMPADGSYPLGSLTVVGTHAYGTTSEGGAHDLGAIFRMSLVDGSVSLLHSFAGGAGDGAGPSGSLVASGGTLYGVTPRGGNADAGTVFGITEGGDFAVLHHFVQDGADGVTAMGSLTLFDGELYGMTRDGGASNFGITFRLPTGGGDLEVLHSFCEAPGDTWSPNGTAILVDGVLYGMTQIGGSGGQGSIYKVNPDGSGFAVLHVFEGGSADGSTPYGALIASGGVLYGMTAWGGSSGKGVIFRINTNGTGFGVLHSFGGAPDDGSTPYGTLTLDGEVLYGMTSLGGSNDLGTVFSITTAGADHTLRHSFAGGSLDGARPIGALLLSGGVLYGLTSRGGSANWGTAFSLDPAGGGPVLLHTFGVTAGDGQRPYGTLAPAGGMLYGMTYQGGTNNIGVVFRMSPGGSGYEVIHTFVGGYDDGRQPYGGLTPSGSLLYGLTYSGGGSGTGVVFCMRRDGSGFQVLHRFVRGGGSNPWVGSVLTDGGGTLYGVTTNGGVAGGGVVFSFDLDAPAITSAGATSFTIGQAKTFTVTTTGYPTPVLTVAGALPQGVSFVDNHDGTATLAGTPAPGTGGTYPLTITASNGAGDDATQAFTLTVIPTERTTLALVSTRNPAPVGAVVKLVAKVTFYSRLYGVPRGTVQFAVDGVPLGGPVPLVSAQATSPAYTMPASSVGVTATYSGDGNFKGSTAKLVQQVSGSLHP